MLFNTGQMQELTGLKREQFRHWRKVLPQLQGRDGRSEQYSFSDVLALCVLRTMVHDLGVNVSNLIASAQDIFALFADSEIGALPDWLFISDDGTVGSALPTHAKAYMAVNLGQLLAEARDRLAPNVRRQLQLPLET
mgnify:CR=1 FL=1